MLGDRLQVEFDDQPCVCAEGNVGVQIGNKHSFSDDKGMWPLPGQVLRRLLSSIHSIYGCETEF